MRFDGNRAWKEANSAITANREVVLALAGVFYLVPSLAVALLFPQPEASTGLAGRAAVDVMTKYYVSALPGLVPMLILQAAGTLILVTLFTDRRRPTVREAIGRGLVGLIPLLLSLLILAVGVGLIGGTILTLASATGAPLLVAATMIVVGMGMAFAWVKSSLAAPVIAVERERNPLVALRRSWALTKGNSLRIAAFYFLVGIAFLVAMTVAMALIGTVLAITVSGKPAEIVAAVVSSTLGTIMTVYFAGILATVHRQLAESPAQSVSATFE